MRCKLPHLCLCYAPINVKPQAGWGGGGRADVGEFDSFTRARVKFPTPGHLENVKFPPLGTAFCPKRVKAMSNSRPQGRTQMSKSPLPLGLNNDRCIRKNVETGSHINMKIIRISFYSFVFSTMRGIKYKTARIPMYVRKQNEKKIACTFSISNSLEDRTANPLKFDRSSNK